MRNIKTKVLIGLGVLLLVMGVGYAVLMTNLTINGTAEITGKWDIYISDIREKTLKDATTIDTNIAGKITANFNVNLEKPGSYAEYEVTVKNEGNLDAVLKGVNGIDEANALAPTDIEYSIQDLELETPIPVDGEIKFTVRVDFKSTATAIPTTNKALTLTLDFEQKTGSSEEPPVDPDVATGIARQVIADKNVDGNAEGLAVDVNESSDIRYITSAPKNYVTFNNETWRIIGVFGQKVKIVRNDAIGAMAWTDNGVNNWEASSLATYLNGEYYNSLNTSARSMITDTMYYLGGVNTTDTGDAASNISIYEYERGRPPFCDTSSSVDCPPYTWTGKIGLMYASDVKESMSWMYGFVKSGLGNAFWTITPTYTGNSVFGFGIINSSYPMLRGKLPLDSEVGIYPTLYLDSNVKIIGGTGTSDQPYQLGM